MSAAAHALANKVPPDPIVVQGPAGPAGIAGIQGPAGIAGDVGPPGAAGAAGSTVKSKLTKKMILKLKGKRPTLLATASCNDQPPGAPTGGAEPHRRTTSAAPGA